MMQLVELKVMPLGKIGLTVQSWEAPPVFEIMGAEKGCPTVATTELGLRVIEGANAGVALTTALAGLVPPTWNAKIR
jgi:hypothetical protein